MLKKITLVLIALVFSFTFGAAPARAISDGLVPDFPSCTSPTGTLKVSYSDGIHGIVGNSGTFTGSDAVYIVGDSNLTQCFCAADGSGIQTNWWKIGSLSQDQFNTLQSQGWIYIPTGLPWGLEDAPYFAQNTNYSCGGSSGGGGSPGLSPAGAPVCNSAVPAAPVITSIVRNGSSATLTWTQVNLADHYLISYGLSPGNWLYGVPNTGNVTSFTINGLDPNTQYYFAVRAVNNCMPSAESTSGQVLGASTGEVLGLANTGNTAEIVAFLSLGFAALILSRLVKKSRAH